MGAAWVCSSNIFTSDSYQNQYHFVCSHLREQPNAGNVSAITYRANGNNVTDCPAKEAFLKPKEPKEPKSKWPAVIVIADTQPDVSCKDPPRFQRILGSNVCVISRDDDGRKEKKEWKKVDLGDLHDQMTERFILKSDFEQAMGIE